MGFTEIAFLFVFLPASVLLYLLAEKLFQKDAINNGVLVLLSFLFYFWADKTSLAAFGAIAALTYLAGMMAEDKRNSVAFPVVCLVGILLFYKYSVQAAEWVNGLADRSVLRLGGLVAPIGLSFVIFESISYVVDIYRGDAEAGNLLECLEPGEMMVRDFSFMALGKAVE